MLGEQHDPLPTSKPGALREFLPDLGRFSKQRTAPGLVAAGGILMTKRTKQALQDWSSIAGDREKYQAYLCSREWAEKREAVRKRAGDKCERCKVLPIDAVHHLTYARKYDEPLENLQAICRPCHDFTHGKSEFDPTVFHNQTMLRFLLEGGAKPPIPAEIESGLARLDELENKLKEMLRGVLVLGSAGLEIAAKELASCLPFRIPYCHVCGERFGWHHDIYECYDICGYNGQISADCYLMKESAK